MKAYGYRTGVHGDVPLPQVHVRRPWWRTPIVVGGGTARNCGCVAGGVATAVSIIVTILATITVIVAVVVAVVAIAGATAIGLARRAWHLGRRQRSGWRVVGVKRHRSNSRTRGVQVDFLQ
jgi:hypothetical protein